MKDLMEKFPYCTKELKMWLVNLMLKTMDSEEVSEEMKQQLIEMTVVDKKIAEVLDQNPRSVLDFFDENKIFIEISVKGGFRYTIHSEQCTVSSEETFATRIFAEKEALKTAFEILENQLNPKEDAGQDSAASSSEIPE